MYVWMYVCMYSICLCGSDLALMMAAASCYVPPLAESCDFAHAAVAP